MKCFIVLSALVAVALARPGHLLESSHHVSHVSHVIPVSYGKLVPAAPVGHDGRVVDTPEVAHAKAAHAAAHAHEKLALAHESSNSAEHLTYAAAPAHVATTYHSVPVATSSYHHLEPVAHAKLVPAAPIGHDGRVVDTLEVAHAKAEHAAAHAHEKVALTHEAAHSADQFSHAPVEHVATTYHSVPVATSSYHVEPVAYKIVPAAPLGHDGRVVDTPEVAHLKAAHLAAHEEAKAAVHSSESYEPHYVSAHQW